MPGITTWANKGQGVYLRENLSGQTAQIGVYDARLSGQGNQMLPLPLSFSSLGLPALERGVQNPCPWFSVDEIGYLDSNCPAYCQGILQLMNHKRLIGVLRKQDLPFLNQLKHREDVCLIDLDKPIAPLGCVIMASGFGRRFGGNKLMTEFGGIPLIQWILTSTEALFSQRVVVTRHMDVAALCREQGISVVVHKLPHRSDTVRLGLEAIGDTVLGCMFCPGDQPLLSKETIQTMALAATHVPELIWQLTAQAQKGTPVLFPNWVFEELKHLPQGKGGHILTKKYPERVHFVPAQNSMELYDIDSPQDLGHLATYLEP